VTSFFFFFFLGYRGIVHPPSADEGTKRTWFEPEQRPRKRVPKRLVHGKQSPQGASKMSWRQDDSGCDVSLNLLVYGEHHMLLRLLSLQLCNEYLFRLKKKEKKSMPPCTRHILAKCHMNELFKHVIATIKETIGEA